MPFFGRSFVRLQFALHEYTGPPRSIANMTSGDSPVSGSHGKHPAMHASASPATNRTRYSIGGGRGHACIHSSRVCSLAQNIIEVCFNPSLFPSLTLPSSTGHAKCRANGRAHRGTSRESFRRAFELQPGAKTSSRSHYFLPKSEICMHAKVPT